MKKGFLIIIILAVLVLAGVCFFSAILNDKQAGLPKQKPITIGFSMGSTREARWARDRDAFVKRAQALGANVIVAASDNDIEKEIFQIENLISQGVDVLVVIPSDSDKIAPAIEKAKQAGIKVIAYDRLINNSSVDFYISYDNEKVGELEASSILSVIDKGKFAYIGGAPTDNNSLLLRAGTMKTLASGVASGTISLVLDKYTEDWKPEKAYQAIKDYLDSGRTLDAVIAANDSTASGVIQALQEKGLAGKVPVSGQDADLSALQRIVAGTQTATIYKPIAPLAEKAAELAVFMASGLTMDYSSSVDNGQMAVPAYYFNPIIVTKDNIKDTIIKDGFYSQADIYGAALK